VEFQYTAKRDEMQRISKKIGRLQVRRELNPPVTCFVLGESILFTH
jgi:hypothetical protein